MRESTYSITQNDAEVERLVEHSRKWEVDVQDALTRVGDGRGWKAIEVGCGPLGALPTLADWVGPGGMVVGLDMDERSLGSARSILTSAGYHQVQLVQANVNDVRPADLCPPGPFDIAFSRNVLTHQPDAAATLRRMAALVRSGGYVIAQSSMGDGTPHPDPDVPALRKYTDWVVPVFQMRGSRWTARQYRAMCEAIGLREVGQRGFFHVEAGPDEIAARRKSLMNWRESVVECGLATDDEIDAVLEQLRDAEKLQFNAVFSALYVELIAQVP